jgi:hypothetical protein
LQQPKSTKYNIKRTLLKVYKNWLNIVTLCLLGYSAYKAWILPVEVGRPSGITLLIYAWKVFISKFCMPNMGTD